ncbi:hypothetical protein Q8F55_008698 [Vanrija albida]|uniref:C2H2-type domain-containing protein n=1 Tax=Vanrija albida TaxID=181172 RepID=A0ABR3PRJ5_9TREE
MGSIPSPVAPHVDLSRIPIPSAYQGQLHAESHDRSNPFRQHPQQQQQYQYQQQQQEVQQQTAATHQIHHTPTRPSPSPTSASDALDSKSMHPLPPGTAPTVLSQSHYTTPSFSSSASTFSQTAFTPPAGPVFPASPDSALRSTSPHDSPSHHRVTPHDQYWQAQVQPQQQQQQQQQLQQQQHQHQHQHQQTQQQHQQHHGQQTYTPSPLYHYEVARGVEDHYQPQQYYYPSQFYQQHPTSPIPITPPAPQQMTAQERRRAKEILKARRHVCPVCDKRFNRPSSLATHMSVHTGAKPYQCNREGCGRRFSVSSNLRRHERTHDMRGGGRSTKTDQSSVPRTPVRQTAAQFQVQQQPVQTPQLHPTSPLPSTTTVFTPAQGYQYIYQPTYPQVEYGGMWHGGAAGHTLRQYAITRRDSAAAPQVVQPTTPPTPPQPILMPQPTKSNSLMLS